MLFHLDKSDSTNLKQAKVTSLANFGFSEKDLENLISKNISKIIPENQLMVLFQERPFDEAADIYALDITGKLYIFELKRWKSNKENILQVLRYGQIFGQYDYQQLNDLLKKHTKNESINLASAHYSYFEEDLESPLDKNQFNHDQVFVVVTNGVDIETLNAAKYWKNKGLNIDTLPYKIYSINDKPFIEISMYNPQGEVLIDEEDGYFIVNTNLTWMKKAYMDMLKSSKAAAYYDRKWAITNVSKGNTVYLYHTGVGIIAKGKAVEEYKKTDIDGEMDEEFYIKLSFDWSINPDNERVKAVTAREINNRLNSGHRFRPTVFSITKEMSDAIDEISAMKI